MKKRDINSPTRKERESSINGLEWKERYMVSKFSRFHEKRLMIYNPRSVGLVHSSSSADPVSQHNGITFDPPADWFDSQNLIACSVRLIKCVYGWRWMSNLTYHFSTFDPKYCDNGFGFECRLTSSVRLSIQSSYDRRFWRGKIVSSSSLRRFRPQRSLPQHDWRRFQNKNDQTRWQKDSSSSLGYG